MRNAHNMHDEKIIEQQIFFVKRCVKRPVYNGSGDFELSMVGA
jgi:hypothetical protein